MRWRQSADIAVRQATGTVARMVRIGCTGTARAATSVSGAARRPTVLAAPTLRHDAMRSNDDGQLAEQRTEAAEALRSALAELESGTALSDFVEGHGIQSWHFVFSWRSDWLSISYRLPYARVLSGEDEVSFDNARIGAAIRMAILLLASDSGEALLHDGEAALSVEAGEFGVRYAITGPDGEEIDSADDWQPLISRLENDLSSAGESLQIIWP